MLNKKTCISTNIEIRGRKWLSISIKFISYFYKHENNTDCFIIFKHGTLYFCISTTIEILSEVSFDFSITNEWIYYWITIGAYFFNSSRWRL